jgi:hypothetical protein
MRAYKFLEPEGVGVFSRFAWPLPDGGPGAWVESEVDPCRAGVHACRRADLPYWVAPALYEVELDAPVTEHVLKLVAARGRLLRRIEAWNDESREAYGEMCLARARELAASGPESLAAWAPPPEITAVESARVGFIAARIAEELGGPDAHAAERKRQSDWLVAHLALA